MPTQMPSTGRAAGQPAADRPLAPDRAQTLHARRVGTDARHQQPVGRHRQVEVGGQRDRRARALDRAHGGPQVA